MNKKIVYKDYCKKDPLRYPFFKYYPDPMKNGVFVECDPPQTCQCCGNQETLICEGPFLTDEDVSSICPECIANGRAAKTFNMDFCEIPTRNRVSDPENPELTNQRLGLVSACMITMKNALDLIGVSAPERM